MSIYDEKSGAVAYVDEALVVVDKPAGLPSVPGRTAGLQDCAYRRVLADYSDALVVHRLDMATSGLLVFARGIDAQRELSRAFAQRRVIKHYVAVVEGQMANDTGSIDLPLRADWPNRPRQIVDTISGKPATTIWRHVESLTSGRSRLDLMPVTGRSHQLRVHLRAIGHPIVGDSLYGPTPTDPTPPERMLLHACRLEFEHPRTGQRIELSSPAPF